MREILFRGKRVNDIGEPKEWIEGYLFRYGIDDYSEETYILGELDHRESVYDIWKCAEKVVPETVGQFTGLLDKNGKWIFEGDIVRHGVWRYNKTGTVEVVEWIDVYCGFEPFSDSKNNCGHCGGGVDPMNCEIIGNIHDNPELLKESGGHG